MPGLDGEQKNMNLRLISFIEIRVAKGNKNAGTAKDHIISWQ
jgi:hypothetical protein